MMTAAEGFEGIDSPLQVSHAMTTHTASIQRDYWTGVDDITEATGQQGSGHIDVRKFGSGTFYFYACLDIDLLASNIVRSFPGLEPAKMRALVRDTALAWLQGMALQNPTGYQNSFAANDIPSTMAVELGASFPYSAAKVFEKPVDSDGSGYDKASAERLVAWDQHRRTVYSGYVSPIHGYGLGNLSTAPGLHDLVKQVSEQLDTIIADIDVLKDAA
jgi:CRISPR system Cascade subunit CasC